MFAKQPLMPQAVISADAEVIVTWKYLSELREQAKAAAPRLMGCICPGDAMPFCQNPLCPRKDASSAVVPSPKK